MAASWEAGGRRSILLTMNEIPTVKDRNRAIVSLTLAMMGAVSSNFRRVALERLDDR